MITAAMTAKVRAARTRVWQALTDAEEILRWDEPALALLERAEHWPSVGAARVWRYRLGTVTVKLRERPLEIVDGERIRSNVKLGLFAFEQSWSLVEPEPGSTHLGLSIAAKQHAIPVLGGELDRFDVRRVAAEYVDAKLRGLRTFLADD